MQKFTVRPTVLKHKANSAGITTVRIAVTVNRKTTYLATPYRIHLKQWDEKKNVIVGHSNAAEMNVMILREVADLSKKLMAKTIEGDPITKRSIKAKGVVVKSFSSFAREVREDAKEINRINNYAPGILLSDMTVTFLRKYEQHERARGMANNTINTSFKYLRRILRQAAAEGLIKENPFDKYGMVKYRQSVRIYLTNTEIGLIMDRIPDLPKNYQITSWYFLLGCFSGLRHSDWGRFNAETMVEDGFLKIRAKKNKKQIVLPIGPTLQKIIDQVKSLPKPATNQKCNDMLKGIGAICGIKKKLSTHVARHSFGYLCATNKIPKSVAAELMGVSVQTVEVYYHLSGENIAKQAEILRSL